MLKILRTCLWILALSLPCTLSAFDFTVTAPGFFYSISGQQNPPLTLTRGTTYTFSISTAGHPFWIKQSSGFSSTGRYDAGVTNNGIQSGTLTFAVPTNAPSALLYQCGNHDFMTAAITIVDPPDFTVTTPGFYTVNGQENPTITLTRGLTYTFDIKAASDHPFQIVRDNGTGEPYDDGVLNNNIFDGRLTFTVPTNAPATLYYICSLHFFGGTINVINPPPPPAPFVKVISISLSSSNVVLRSSGTNGWNAVPEFKSNLLSTTWTTVPGYTNNYSNGTNTTTFNRLEPICGSNVFLRIRNSTN